MDELKRIGLVWLKWAAIAAACFAVAAWLTGCNVIGGLGRDLSAWADGGATEASENAAAIRGKGQ